MVGIFGDPVDHSLSPRMHNAAFAELGLDFVYVPLRPKMRRIKDAVQAVKRLGLAGVNVTVPFKHAVIPHLDSLSPTARAVGAVNTIYFDAGKLIGDNTDAPGFVAALSWNGFRPRGKRVLVIGAGGSARAVVFGLLGAKAADVVVCNRTPSKATRLAKDLSKQGRRVTGAPLDILDDFDFLASRQLVVNCTSVGLSGNSFLDYDIDSTPADCVHFDLAYRETATPFLALAQSVRRPTIDGRHMLVHQGALSFKSFTGRRAPVETMARAIGIKPPK